jgi:hypothetical protein
MTGAGFDVKDLNRIASTLADGAQELSGLAGNAPAMPDAGVSSGAVGNGISALANVMEQMVKTAANAADKAQTGVKAYAQADDSSQGDLSRIKEPR